MSVKILEGPCIANLASLDSESIQCVVTSPPYFQCRTYGDHTQEIGHESSPDDYIASLMQVLGEIRRVLKDDGVVWVDIGDVFAKKNYPETAMHPKIRKGEAMLLPYLFAMEARRGGVVRPARRDLGKTQPDTIEHTETLYTISRAHMDAYQIRYVCV